MQHHESMAVSPRPGEADSIIIAFGGDELQAQGAQSLAVGDGQRGGIWRVNALDGVPEDAVKGIAVVQIRLVEAYRSRNFLLTNTLHSDNCIQFILNV
jgi:hypothetical protein